MNSLRHRTVMSALLVVALATPVAALRPFQPQDVFELEWASDPRIAPDGETVVYVRNGFDVMTDRVRSELWIVGSDGSGHRPLVTAAGNVGSPRWSPGGDRLLYVRRGEDGAQLALCWIGGGEPLACDQTAAITRLTESPSAVSWSPDGEWIAFSMREPAVQEPLAKLPRKPEGAEWAEAPKLIDELVYRADGAGYVEEGYRHLFVVPVEGGTPRRITSGEFDHDSTPRWTPDGDALVFSSNREEGWRYDPLDSELYEVRLEDGSITALTERQGPDADPVVSPDGRRVAYVGFDDDYQGYQVSRLHVLDRTAVAAGDGASPRVLTADLDRSVDSPRWSADGSGIYFQYDDEGETKIGFATLDGEVRTVAGEVGGTSLGRPYPGGSFSVAADGRIAYTVVGPDHPADVAVVSATGDERRRLTELNRDLLSQRDLAAVEEIWFESSHDGRRIQGWIVTPPGFDPEREYPLLLEIHGGPFANYGPRFAAEIQLYAARGYLVLYTNPRGSTSYGGEFGNLIHHAYPGHDYDDLMSGVDATLERGYVDPERLYVTGGSGGGVLSAWIVGSTDRFRAAAVQKPVINWLSFALTADFYTFFHRYWFPALPWEDPMDYWQRSPLSRVGEVETPTLVITGEQDYRTPISESEQFYQALKLQKVDAAMVRIPGASHHIAARPSHLLGKVLHVLGWFAEHGGPAASDSEESGT